MADEQIVTSIVAKADLSSLVSEVHRVTASLQQLQRELIASNKSIAAATKVANNAFRDTLVQSGLFSSHFVNLNSDVDKFGKNLDSGRLKLRDYFSTFQTHIKTSKGLIRELAREQVMLENAVLQPLGRNAQGLMQYNVHIPRGLDTIKNKAQLARMELQIFNRALLEGSSSLINWGKNTQWAGRQLTVGLTVPLTMFGTAAAKAFREADQELTRLVKVYGDIAGTSSQELGKIRKEVVDTAKELSSAMGVSFKETLALAADVAATGKTGQDLIASVKETTRLAVLGEVDRQEAMKATLAIQTAFKSNTEELTESINFLNAVENQTSTTLNDLVEAIPKAGTVVKQLGGSVEDLALYITAMREGGVNASEAANALKSGLASMINPTKQTIGVMSDFGIDIMGMVQRNTGDTTAMILDLQKALEGLDPLSKARALEQMFGKFQFARMAALFNNLGKSGSQTLQVMQLMNASASELASVAGRELELVTESASGKFRRAVESLKASLSGVGEEFLNFGTRILNVFEKIVNFFSNLPDPIKKFITLVGGLTAVAGPLIMITGVLANFFGYITKGIVLMRSFFQGTKGWKMLTPEMIAAEHAARMVEKSFYSDAAAANVLHSALQKLITDYASLRTTMNTGAIPVNPTVSTVAGSVLLPGIRREVDPASAYAGELDTRAMSHINPRDPNNPASLMGVVPGAIPVNRGIGRVPQIYMNERLPDIEGLTSVKGISTGIVSGEAAKFHALMATLGMQTKEEVEALKKTIGLGGTVSKELLDTFDDILPITSRIADGAATQSAAIVAELRAGTITVETAKSRIIALNAQIDAMLRQEIGLFAASRGRTIDFTKAPLMDQPVVDANGQFTLRDLYKKEANKSVLEEIGRLRGVRTFGAPYSIETTRLPKFNQGGSVEGFSSGKTVVSGPTSITYDDRIADLPLGGYVVNQAAAMDPNNRWLHDIAPSTYTSSGPTVRAAVTPGELVLGDGINKDPMLYAAVDAINNGYNLGGGIVKSLRRAYGKAIGSSDLRNLYAKIFKVESRVLNSPNWQEEVRLRSIMHDASILHSHVGYPEDKAIEEATRFFDEAWDKTYDKNTGLIDPRDWMRARISGAKKINAKLNSLIAKGEDIRNLESYRGAGQTERFRPTSQLLGEFRAKALSGGFGGVDLFDRVIGSLYPLGFETTQVKGKEFLPVSEHVIREGLWTDGKNQFSLAGNFGMAMLGEREINSLSADIHRATGAARPDQIPLTNAAVESDRRQQQRRNVNFRSSSMSRSTRAWLLNAVMGNLDARSYFMPNAARFSYSGYNIGGPIRSNKLNYGELYPGTNHEYPSWVIRNEKLNIGNDDPAHGPLQIGRYRPPLTVRTRRVPASISYSGRYHPYTWDQGPRKGETVWVPGQSGARQAFLTGSAEERAKYITENYMRGAYDVMGMPGSKEALKSVVEKVTGRFYRGITLGGWSRVGGRMRALPEWLEKEIIQARATGDYSKLVGKEFIIRRSSWSSNPATARGFGDFFISANVKNRNALRASKMFPSLTFSDPRTGKQSNVNESESFFGGKFKILSIDKDGMKVQGTYNKGGRVNRFSRGGGAIRRGVSNYGRLPTAEELAQRKYGDLKPSTPPQVEGGAPEGTIGRSGMGLAMGSSIIGGFGGYELGMRLSGGNMLAGMAGSIGGEIAMYHVLGKLLNRQKEAIKTQSLMQRAFGLFARMPGPAKLVAVVIGLGLAIKKVNDVINNHRNTVSLAFGPTEDIVEKLNLKFTSLDSTVTSISDKMKAFRESGGALYASYTSAGIPGLTLTIKQLKELQERVSQDFPNLIQMFNQASGAEVSMKAEQLKAQFVAGGMSAQEATNLIYALISQSNKATYAIKAIASEGFRAIKDEATAAESAIRTFFNLVSEGNLDQLVSSFDTVFNALQNSENKLIGMELKQYGIVDAAEAYAYQLEKINNSQNGQNKLGGAYLEQLKSQNLVLQTILGDTETLASIYAKLRLYAMGLNADIAGLDPQAAQDLSVALMKMDTFYRSSSKESGGKNPFGKLVDQINKAKEASKAADTEAFENTEKRKEALEELIETHQKAIEKIREEAAERRQALEREAEDEDILLQIKKKQLEYNNALASGDMQTAAQAQLDIQRLVGQQQKEFAKRAIDDKEKADIEKEQSAIDALKDQIKALQDQLEVAQDTAKKGLEDANALQDLLNRAIQVIMMGQGGYDDFEKGAAAQVIKDLQSSTSKEAKALIPYLQESLKNNGKTFNDQVTQVLKDLNLTLKEIKPILDKLNNSKLPEVDPNKKVLGSSDDVTGAGWLGAWLMEQAVKRNWFGLGDKYYTADQWKKITGKKEGGYLRGPGTGTSDSIPGYITGFADGGVVPIRVSNTEYITRSSSVRDIGVSNMDLINQRGSDGVIMAAKNILGVQAASGGYVNNLMQYAKGSTGGLTQPKFNFNKMNDRIAYAMSHLTSKGMTKEAAAGIVGNLLAESSLRPSAEEVGNTQEGRGIAQWGVNARWKTYQNWLKRNNRKDIYDLANQLDFIWWEMHNGQLKDPKEFNQLTDISKAAYIFMNQYERPGILRWKERNAFAYNAYKLFTGNDYIDAASTLYPGPDNAKKDYESGLFKPTDSTNLEQMIKEMTPLKIAGVSKLSALGFNKGGYFRYGTGGYTNPFAMGMEWFGDTLVKGTRTLAKEFTGLDPMNIFGKKSKKDLFNMATMAIPFGGAGKTGAKALSPLVAEMMANGAKWGSEGRAFQMAAIDKEAVEGFFKTDLSKIKLPDSLPSVNVNTARNAIKDRLSGVISGGLDSFNANDWEVVQALRVMELSKKFPKANLSDIKTFNELYAKEFYGMVGDPVVKLFKGVRGIDPKTALSGGWRTEGGLPTYWSTNPYIAATYSMMLGKRTPENLPMFSMNLPMSKLPGFFGEGAVRNMQAQGSMEFPMSLPASLMSEFASTIKQYSLPGNIMGSWLNVVKDGSLQMKNLWPKFHDWNGTVPGPYGQEVGAILKAGTEGVYQSSYINALKNGTMNEPSSRSKVINIGSVKMEFTEPVTNGKQIFEEFKALVNFENSKSGPSINVGLGA